MKKILTIALFIFGGLVYGNEIYAQVQIRVNIGDQPAWAPEGYDDAQYYYLPDMDVYYDVPAHQFLYLHDKHWVRSSVLPSSYRKFDLYKVHKVAVNKPDAYKYHRQDKQQYAQYKGKNDQTSLRDSHNDKYSNNKNNWSNNRFKKGNQDDHRDQGHDKH